MFINKKQFQELVYFHLYNVSLGVYKKYEFTRNKSFFIIQIIIFHLKNQINIHEPPNTYTYANKREIYFG